MNYVKNHLEANLRKLKSLKWLYLLCYVRNIGTKNISPKLECLKKYFLLVWKLFVIVVQVHMTQLIIFVKHKWNISQRLRVQNIISSEEKFIFENEKIRQKIKFPC